MLTIEQLREMTEAARALGYVSEYGYARGGYDRERVDRVIAAYAAIRLHMMRDQEIETMFAGIAAVHVLSNRIKSGNTIAATVIVEVAEQLADWWKGEGKYEPAEEVEAHAHTEPPPPPASETTPASGMESRS